MYEDPREDHDDSYEPPPSHKDFSTTPLASFPRGEYLGEYSHMKNFLYTHLFFTINGKKYVLIFLSSSLVLLMVKFILLFTLSFYFFKSLCFAVISLFQLEFHWSVSLLHTVEPKPQYTEGFMQMLTSCFCFCFSFPDNCRNRPGRPPRKPLRPDKASKQLPPEPTELESDEVKQLWFPTLNSHTHYQCMACVLRTLPQTLLCLGEFHHILCVGKYLPKSGQLT